MDVHGIIFVSGPLSSWCCEECASARPLWSHKANWPTCPCWANCGKDVRWIKCKQKQIPSTHPIAEPRQLTRGGGTAFIDLLKHFGITCACYFIYRSCVFLTKCGARNNPNSSASGTHCWEAGVAWTTQKNALEVFLIIWTIETCFSLYSGPISSRTHCPQASMKNFLVSVSWPFRFIDLFDFNRQVPVPVEQIVEQVVHVPRQVIQKVPVQVCT